MTPDTPAPPPAGPGSGGAQRRWSAACPNCGAPVSFASAAAPVAVCSFCRSTLARDGESLRRIGVAGELFDDHSPLQLGAAGRWQGRAFTLVGRLQMGTDESLWNEWHALFDDGASGWLSEDNGRYVMSFEAPPPTALDALSAPGQLAQLRPGQSLRIDGRSWPVASVVSARVAAAEGELPSTPQLQRAYTVVELRNAWGEVASIDDAAAPPLHWFVGQSAPLGDMALTGLRDVAEKNLGSRGLACPNCGAAVALNLESTRSVVCAQCRSVIDVSQGVGGDLAHYRQQRPREAPKLPLGAVGTLALGGEPGPWQVVGYLEREELGGDAGEPWSEYLLYRREVGFAFLVDAEDGWSWVVPITGAPEVKGSRARWRGVHYQQRFLYTARTTFVMGEFYWRVERGQQSRNIDYAAGDQRLNREQSGNEVTWSAGETIDAADVFRAFGVAPPAMPVTLAPFQASSGGGLLRKAVIAFFVVLVLMQLLERCSRDECDDLRATFGANSAAYQSCLDGQRSGVRMPRSGGGSWGGGSWGGGGHK